MSSKMLRREFLKTAPTAAVALAQAARGASSQSSAPAASLVKIEPFDFRGVKLLESRWQKQMQSARDYYYSISDDDILHGFRAEANLPAPGKTLGGWAARDSGGIFGQWLSAMSRIYRATGDSALRDKAVKLVTEFAKTVKSDGDTRMRHYAYEKLVCGLVDMQLYADHADSIGLLEKVTDAASKTLDRTRAPAGPIPWEMHSGRPGEWYTLSENLFRAYLLTKNPKFKEFAEVWLYPVYWNKFANTSDPADAWGVHAYSHVNTFSSASMAFAVSADPTYLRIVKNAFDFLQNTQCYATGGYGPAERILPTNGNLGKSLEGRMDSFECPCGSWAGFKMARYLTQFTGESRYGDWAERLLYNGVGAALPIKAEGKGFYYADFRMAGLKYYHRSSFHCCTGSYFQDMAEYHNQIYFKDKSSLYVNLYLPSEVVWGRPEGEVKLTLETRFPEEETIALTLNPAKSAAFGLRLRVPGWAKDMSIKVNGSAVDAPRKPGTWAAIDRTWSPGDKVEVRFPLAFRMQPIDRWHPHRSALVRGPVVYVQEGNTHEPIFPLPEREDDLNKRLVPGKNPGIFKLVPQDGTDVQGLFHPYYEIGESHIYRMYYDLDKLPFILWTGPGGEA